MNNSIIIGIAELRAMVDPKQSLEERLKVAMRAALGHWCVLDEENQFKMAVGAVMVEATEEEQERIKVDLKFLSAMASAASEVPVDFVRLAEELEGSETKAIGLRKLWDEVKAEKRK